jgi:hypothetical protein
MRFQGPPDFDVLAKAVESSEILNENCTGIYIPRERALIPNDDSLYLELHKLGSACESGVRASG